MPSRCPPDPDATLELLQKDMHRLCEPSQLTLLKTSAAVSSPWLFPQAVLLARLQQGVSASIGLGIVYFVWAELCKSYTMWLALGRIGAAASMYLS